MNDVQLEHPTRERLAAFGLGQLNEGELAEIEGHLATCVACRQVAESVADDTLIALLRSAATEPESIERKDLQQPATRTASGSAAVAPEPGLPAALADHPRYRVLALLGVGGMGAVYKAEHLLMARPVALKVINRELIDKPPASERFRREVRAAARLTHPNIVTAFDAEQAGDLHFLVMEYIDGVSLARRSAEKGPLPVAEACGYVRQAALGLQHAHECGMVHRDIKPQNLMLTPAGQVKILDFGLARFAMESSPAGGLVASADEPPIPAREAGPAEPLTQTGTVMGTPDYIAPEQARDPHTADIRADIYSLGCTLYDLLAGHAPFPEGTAVQKVKAHMDRTPKPLRDIRRDVPPELTRVIERMMAKGAADRFQTPAEVVEALAPFLRAAPQPPRGKKWLAVAAAVGVAAALLAGVVIYVTTDKGKFVIETNDDKIAVMIQKAGGVEIVDQANHREYWLQPGENDLRTGDYKIEVSDALAGLEFDVKEFKLTRGKEVRVTARFVPKDAVGGLDIDAFAWFPEDCTFFVGRDLRAHAGLGDQQLLILAQILADAGLKDRMWKLKSILGRIDRISAAFAADRKDPSKSRVFVRVSGLINHERIVDWFRHEYPGVKIQEHPGFRGDSITLISSSQPIVPAAALVNDSDLLLARYVGPAEKNVDIVEQVLEVRASRRAMAGPAYRRLWRQVPRHAWAVIMGEVPEPMRRLLTSKAMPFRVLPDTVVLTLQGDKTTEVRFAGTFTNAEKARSFADNIRSFQKLGITFVRNPPAPLKFTLGTSYLLVEALQTLKVETAGDRVTGEMQVRDQARDALTDALRGVPLSAVRSLLPPLDKLFGSARTSAKERLAVLKELAAQTEQGHASGAVPFEQVLEAKLQVRRAELDLCESDKELVKVHEKIVTLLKEMEKGLDQGYREGAVPRSVLLKAKADRLEAETALEQAKAKAATPAR